jgi:DNA-binding MarR family transcriptional regulator
MSDGAIDAAWLTADEQAAWLRLVRVVVRLPAALDSQLHQDAGLRHFEYMVLARLSEAEDRTLRMSDLAALANGSLSRLSHVVSRLETQGWVERTPCPEDRRATNAVLTGAGWEKVVATAPGHVRRVRELVIDALSPTQLQLLTEIGDRILERIDPDGWMSTESSSPSGGKAEESRP